MICQYVGTCADRNDSPRVDSPGGRPHSLRSSCPMLRQAGSIRCRGKERGDDARSRHYRPAPGCGARDRAAGGTATTIKNHERPSLKASAFFLSRRSKPVIPAVMPTYGRWDVAVERGEGLYLYS